MKRKSYAILFYLKRSKLNKRGEAPIYMRITIDGLRAEASIHRSIKPEQWNTEKGSAYPVSDNAKNLNRFLEQQRHLVYGKQEELINKEKIVSAKSLKNAYIGKNNDDERTVLKTYDDHNAKLKLRIGKDVSRLTHVRHEPQEDI